MNLKDNNKVDLKEEKIRIEDYKEKLSIKIAGQFIVFAENPVNSKPYFVYTMKNNNPLGLEEYAGIATNDYIEAMREFVNKIDKSVEELENERNEAGLPFCVLSADDCILNGNDDDWEGKLLILNPLSLSPEYRSSMHQLVICIGGFGSKPNARGRAVFVKELFSGKEMRYERSEVAGVADLSKIPEWALKKLESLKTE